VANGALLCLWQQRKWASVAPLAKSDRYAYESRVDRGHSIVALKVANPENAKEAKRWQM